jgi:hypothetical protein
VIGMSDINRWGARLGLATLVSAAALVAGGGGAYGAAQPPGNDNWLLLDGTCGGQPATLLDPKGGTTAFLVGGTVGIGKVFTFYNADTNEILEQTVNGRGVDSDRLVTCEFLFEDVPAPGGGTIDVRFEVQALLTPQGP